jgi:hypothetical protein
MRVIAAGERFESYLRKPAAVPYIQPSWPQYPLEATEFVVDAVFAALCVGDR